MKKGLFFVLSTLYCTICLSQEIPNLDWDALQETKPWEATEKWTPVPEKVVPGIFSAAPSDAIVLFDGKNLDAWQKPQFPGEPARMDLVEAWLALEKEIENEDAHWTVIQVRKVNYTAIAVLFLWDYMKCKYSILMKTKLTPMDKRVLYTNSTFHWSMQVALQESGNPMI